ncbi:peroxiredoxin [Synechococcus sp. CCY9201]|uniref:peroxiredoxin n=1 Tax=unclassified Synechococcus TaxID=2626047 RepID=UPI002AD3036D|nr:MULTISPECIES: peroxiredoxin [unclassified Synechococcus]MEA5475930.1 peroxiredoxin [Synechococcus sp. CCY9201]
MHRRPLLQGLAMAALGLLGHPRQAFAMGGTLPSLDTEAPAFDLEGVVAGAIIHRSLTDFAGRWLVLYFYPKDFTGGCTLEARGFQRDLAAFAALDANVVGISADDPEAHASFCDSEGLAFPLLSDPGGTVSQRYGSWIPPFSQRHTFLIDPAGILRQRWVAVRPTLHSQEVLGALQSIQGKHP